MPAKISVFFLAVSSQVNAISALLWAFRALILERYAL